MDYAFQTKGLVKRFGKKTALSGLDLAAPAGTVLGVLGPNPVDFPEDETRRPCAA